VNRHRKLGGGQTRLPALTWVEVVIILVVVGILVALLLPALQMGREATRRMQCTNSICQLGLALHNYAEANKVFPPGTLCATSPTQPSNQYDVWGEAADTGKGFQGTGFLLRILPYLEDEHFAKAWNYGYGISNTTVVHGASNYSLANRDIKGFYCPSRRDGLRPGDNVMMLLPSWTGGGTDYGGCAGRYAAFTLQTGYNLCDATMYYKPNFYPAPFKGQADDTAAKRWGIFGRVNVSTSFKEISDGTSYTFMTGELQRVTTISPTSKDGWAIGGPATLFTTGAMMSFNGTTVTNVASPTAGALSNNMFWGSPGSDHVGGANYGMADGSVRFYSTAMDANIFALMGSMADGVGVKLDD
jgi:prepilin-type processing-associated H-X9-DG protein